MRLTWTLAVALLSLGLPGFARAELGGDEATVQADQARFKGARRTSRTAGYAVHEIQAASGTAIREYVSADGKVFAVAWSGPFLPDLRQLLGAHFERYSQHARAKAPRRGPLAIDEPELSAFSGGHLRGFFGRAILPALLPRGVAAADIR